MRETMLTNLSTVQDQYDELQQYSNILPENLMNRERSALEESIPNAGNEILSLLNLVSGEYLFDRQNTVLDLINLLNNRAKEVESAFELIPANENIIGFDGGKTYTAKDILGYQRFWFNAHCDIIDTTLTAGRITAKRFKR